MNDNKKYEDKLEEEVIEYESKLNEGLNLYFSVRTSLLRTRQQELIFEAGFRFGIKGDND